MAEYDFFCMDVSYDNGIIEYKRVRLMKAQHDYMV